MARPSLADSLKASLSKGIHVDTAAKIARGFQPLPDEIPTPIAVAPAIVKPVVVPEPVVAVAGVSVPVPVEDPQAATLSDRVITEPTDGHTVKLSDSKTVEPSHGHTEKPSYSSTDIPSDIHTVPQPDSQAVLLSHHQTVEQPQTPSQTVPQTHYQTPLQYVPLEVLNLAYNQACVLECLIGNAARVTNYREISDRTHIGKPSVREAMSRLVAKGFMHPPVTVKNAAFQGFSYVLNKTLCDHFLAAGGLSQQNYREHSQTRYQTVPQTVRESDRLTVSLLNRQTTHSSSGFEDLKPTTTSGHQTASPSEGRTISPSDSDTLKRSDLQSIKPSEGFILTGAVGAYWEEEGLGEGQAQKWCQQFEVEPEQMRQQLEWARFDLENNGRRGEVKKDTVSWFFGHLRQTSGCFPRPINYKSPAEIRAEAIEQDLAREKEVRERLAAAEAELSFQKILADPTGNDYQVLLSQVDSFARDMGGKALETALREVFLKERG